MKKFIFFILILIVCSCKKEDSKTTVLPTATSTQVNTIIYSSKSFELHLNFNTELSEYELINLTNPESFTDLELSYPIRENDFEFDKTEDFKYYTPFSFDFEDVAYKLIAYHSYGENDLQVVNMQLNSYLEGKQIDALLVDCRFTFETEYYREFTIAKDGVITIKKIAIDGLNYNNDGDILGEKTVKDTTAETVRYKLSTKGIFVKM